MQEISKRQFLQAAAGAGLMASPFLSLSGLAGTGQPTLNAYPFQLGVASGALLPDGFVLWTRLTRDPLSPPAGDLPKAVPVDWQVSTRPDMSVIVASGRAIATAGFAHSVHVDIRGLSPATIYWYRFYVSGIASPIGRTKTLPSGTDAAECRFASVSCQNYTHGFYTAYRGIIADDPDFVLHLGDYIYEKPFGGTVRALPSETPPRTLDEFRIWHSLYKLDPDLQAAHAVLPFVLTLDNHDATEDGRHDQHAVRAAAYQAWYEHMPVRRFWNKDGQGVRLPSKVQVANLMSIHVMDTRQYRDRQSICSDSAKPEEGFGNYRKPCPERLSEDRSLLGHNQMTQLASELVTDTSHWTVLASTVPFAPYQFYSGEEERFYIGSWDGYPAARQVLTNALAAAKLENVIVVSGDVHSAWCLDLSAKASDPDTCFGTEFIGTSISSNWPEPLAHPMRDSLSLNPHVRFQDMTKRGYTLHEVTADAWKAVFKTVGDVTVTQSDISTQITALVKSGKPGLYDLKN